MYSVLLLSRFARWQNVQIDIVRAKFAIFSFSFFTSSLSVLSSPLAAARNASRRLFASNARTRNEIAPLVTVVAVFFFVDDDDDGDDSNDRCFPNAHSRKISLYTDFAIFSNSSPLWRVVELLLLFLGERGGCSALTTTRGANDDADHGYRAPKSVVNTRLRM